MKNKVISLTKVFLKNSYSPNSLKNSENKKKSKFGMIALYLFVFVYLGAIVGFLSFSMISSLIAIHQEAMFIGLILVAIAFFIIFQTIFTSINVFYFSKDIEQVLPLPIKPREILMAKFNVILITEYMMELILGVVPLIIYGILTGAGFLYYLFALFVLLIFPILPLLLVCFIIMIIMSFAKLAKNRDRFQMITTVITIILVIAIQFTFSSNGEELTEDQMMQMIVNSNGMVEIISRYFITVKPAINLLTANTWISFLIEPLKLIGITLFAYLLFIGIGDKIYLRGAIGNLGSGGAKKRQKKIDVEKAYKQKEISFSYVKKEFKTLLRNPIFFMQCVLPPVLMPILIMVVSFAGMNSTEEEIFSQIPEITGIIPICIMIAAIQFFAMMSFIALTAVSRDGENATFMKYIPLSLHKQFQYKIIPDILMNTLTILIVLVAVYLFLKPSIFLLLVVFGISMLLNIFQSYLMLLTDLKKPKLKWNTEYAVVKQNMNMLYEIIFAFVLIGILVLIGFIFSNVNIFVPILIMVVIFGGAVLLIDRYVAKNQIKLFKKII